MGRMNQTSFTQEERGALTQKIRDKMTADGIEEMIVTGSSNITFLAGLVFPYIDQELVHPVALYISFTTNRQIIACTFDLSDIPEQLGWTGETLVYELTESTPEKSLAAALAERISGENAVIAADFEQMTGGQLDAFKAALPDHDFQPADDTLRALRIIKTPAEVRLLEIAGRMGDRGFISALNHAEGAALDTLSYPMWEYGERFRVHVGEFGGSGVGNLSILQGERGRDLYGETGVREVFHENEFLRMEFSTHNYGYWNTGARTVYIGKPDAAAEKAWAENLALKRTAVNALNTGISASDVFHAVAQAAEEADTAFCQEFGVGHGVGAAEREPPFLAPYDDTVLAPGMVVVVAVYTCNARAELIVNKDTYLITEAAPELLTWYKNWDDLYTIYGTSARHG